MPKTSIGKLDKRVTFQWSPLDVKSPQTGGRQPDWVNIATVPTVWAMVVSKEGGGEIDERGKLQPKAIWEVTIRRRTDLTTRHRILYGGKILYVKEIGDVSSRSEFVMLSCTEYPP